MPETVRGCPRTVSSIPEQTSDLLEKVKSVFCPQKKAEEVKDISSAPCAAAELLSTLSWATGRGFNPLFLAAHCWQGDFSLAPVHSELWTSRKVHECTEIVLRSLFLSNEKPQTTQYFNGTVIIAYTYRNEGVLCHLFWKPTDMH